MKIVKIQGGLGNQMFGYAIALTLKKKFPNTLIKLDTSSFKYYKLHNGFELYDVFDCPYFESAAPKEIAKLTWYSTNPKVLSVLRRVMPRRRTECIERPVSRLRPDAFTSDRDYYYDGYWQWSGYYSDIRDYITGSFRFKLDVLTSKQLQTVEQINNVNSVGIHIRRGDYLTEKLYMGICGLDYYQNAIDHIKTKVTNPVYYIFSNDIAWCKENILQLTECRCVFVENTGKYSYIDMYMMTQCKNLIIANSSFSYWSAYLNKYQGMIVSPEKWVNLPIGRRMQPDNWILIK